MYYTIAGSVETIYLLRDKNYVTILCHRSDLSGKYKEDISFMDTDDAEKKRLTEQYDYYYERIKKFGKLKVLSKDAEYWINMLHLQEHPEGGYFVQTYKSEKFVRLPEYSGSRHACTAIYYLLVGDQFSSFHILKSDELWHFYAGSSLTLHIIEKEGRLNEVKLGENFANKEIFQAVVKSGSWFAASVNEHNSYSLVGCTVSPGFDYDDWELADINTLMKIYPQHKSIIEKYTKPISAT